MLKQLSLLQKFQVLDEAAEMGNVKKPLQSGMCIHLRFANGENL